MRIAIFGGTFDPVHLGHLQMADEVRSALSYDRILFVPTHHAPHKERSPEVDGDARLRMLEIAIAGRPEFEIEKYEVEKAGVSYTVDTIRHVIATREVSGRPGLIVGWDLLEGFESWRGAEELVQLVDLIVVRRPGYKPAELSQPHFDVENALLDLSASEIRARLSEGKPVRYLLHPDVYEYIQDHGLYQDA